MKTLINHSNEGEEKVRNPNDDSAPITMQRVQSVRTDDASESGSFVTAQDQSMGASYKTVMSKMTQ